MGKIILIDKFQYLDVQKVFNLREESKDLNQVEYRHKIELALKSQNLDKRT